MTVSLLTLFLSLLVSLFTNYAFLKAFKHELRERERERTRHRQETQELLDRLMHVTGNTWVVPPRETKDVEIDDDTKLALEGWVDA